MHTFHSLDLEQLTECSKGRSTCHLRSEPGPQGQSNLFQIPLIMAPALPDLGEWGDTHHFMGHLGHLRLSLCFLTGCAGAHGGAHCGLGLGLMDGTRLLI